MDFGDLTKKLKGFGDMPVYTIRRTRGDSASLCYEGRGGEKERGRKKERGRGEGEARTGNDDDRVIRVYKDFQIYWG